MDEHSYEEFEVSIEPDQPVFVIGVVSDMVGIPIWTLRKLDELGVVTPKRLSGRTRCYSRRQLKKLLYIHYLMQEQNVNISGLKYVLKIQNVTAPQKEE